MPRIAQTDYNVPNSDIVIEKGTTVFIPVHAIHNDPEYYPNPDRFDPSRFEAEEMKKRNTMTWLGFGGGPRRWYVDAYRFNPNMLTFIFLSCAKQYWTTFWNDTNSSGTDYNAA